MADMRKVEEGSAFPNKRKLDLPNPIKETLEQKDDVEQDGSDSNKRQKLEISTENEKNTTCSFTDDGEKMPVDNRADENNNKDGHVMGEPDIVGTGERVMWADKGMGILIEESEEEEEDDSDDYGSSDDSSDDSTDYSSYDSSDCSFFSDESCDDSDSSELSDDSGSESIRYY